MYIYCHNKYLYVLIYLHDLTVVTKIVVELKTCKIDLTIHMFTHFCSFLMTPLLRLWSGLLVVL